MRYMLMVHRLDADALERSTEWIEETVGFLARFEDRLATTSELEWSEVLGSDAHAELIGPDGAASPGWFNTSGKPLRRMWAVRVSSHERAIELAEELAGELDTWVEVRECMPTSQRP